MRFVIAAFALLLALQSAPLRAAEKVPLAAFFGEWQGSGISKTSTSAYFDETVRDFDVTIRDKAPGFTLGWTTVLRQGGDPNNPDVRRKTAMKEFQPAPGGGYYLATDSGDPLTGETTWARLEGRTLSLYILSVSDQGLPQMLVYARTLEAPGMSLRFTRVTGDEETRSVEGRLVKVAK